MTARGLVLGAEAAAALISVRLLGWSGTYGDAPDPPTPEAWRHAARVDRVANLLRMKDACLPRAVALQRLLRRRGIKSHLRLGVRKRSGQLESHAWLEMGGEILIGNLPDLNTFEPLEPRPGSAT